jgi:hypothetical protein
VREHPDLVVPPAAAWPVFALPITKGSEPLVSHLVTHVVGVWHTAHVRLPKYEHHTNRLREVRSWRWHAIKVQLPAEGPITWRKFQDMENAIFSRG